MRALEIRCECGARRRWTRPAPLVAGERVRLTPGGPVLTVVRVTPCAAYVGRETVSTYDVRVMEDVTDPGTGRVLLDPRTGKPRRRATGETRTITRRTWDVDPISVYSAVERVT